MLLADSNVWLALALSKHDHHVVVGEWFVRQKTRESVLLCRATQQTLLRLLTTKAVLAPYRTPPLENKAAWMVLEGILADKRVAWTEEPRGLDACWKKFALTAQASPKLWMNAYLAGFAIAGGHRLVTIDKAFKQFKGLDLLLLSKD